MGSGGGQTQTTNSAPWSAQQPYLQYGFGQAQDIYNQGPQQFFPGQTYANQSPETLAGLNAATQRATSGSPVTSGADNYASGVLNGSSQSSQLTGLGGNSLGATASGAFLNSNPYLDQTYNAASSALDRDYSNNVIPGISSQFGSSGGANSALAAMAQGNAAGQYGDSKANLAAQIYGGNYANERSNMNNAANQLYGTGTNQALNVLGMSPQLAQADYNDANMLQQVGQSREQFAGNQIQDAINRWNFGQQAPLSSLQDYMSLIQGNYGGTSVSRGSGGNGLMQGLGGAATLLSLL